MLILESFLQSLLFGRSFQYGITLRISRAVLDAVRNLLPLCLPSKVRCEQEKEGLADGSTSLVSGYGVVRMKESMRTLESSE